MLSFCARLSVPQRIRAESTCPAGSQEELPLFQETLGALSGTMRNVTLLYTLLMYERAKVTKSPLERSKYYLIYFSFFFFGCVSIATLT